MTGREDFLRMLGPLEGIMAKATGFEVQRRPLYGAGWAVRVAHCTSYEIVLAHVGTAISGSTRSG